MVTVDPQGYIADNWREIRYPFYGLEIIYGWGSQWCPELRGKIVMTSPIRRVIACAVVCSPSPTR
jgi:hypothetical protein